MTGLEILGIYIIGLILARLILSLGVGIEIGLKRSEANLYCLGSFLTILVIIVCILYLAYYIFIEGE